MSTAPFADSRKDSTGVTTTYQTVELKDGNVWLAENFNYFVNDDVCQTSEGYRVDSEQLRKDGVGLYYDWHAFASNLSLIPAGWHLPTVQEWKAMVDCYGGLDNAYEHLLKGGSSGFNMEMAGGTYIPGQDCKQLAMDNLAFFWSASEGDDKGFAAALMVKGDHKKAEIEYLHKRFRFNVRLVKDK